MSRVPAISLALRAHGFTHAAEVVERATDGASEILALRLALATIDGATHVLRIHARALRNTSAAYERGKLRGLEETITVRLGDLLRRARLHQVAQDVHMEKA